MMMNPSEFKALFPYGKSSHEGLYALQNEMSIHPPTPEYLEIIFQLKGLIRHLSHFLIVYEIKNQAVYDFFLRLEETINYIEYIGPGYDESKHLTRLISAMFEEETIDNFVSKL